MTIYLYVKQHTLTGLKYFGMTRHRNPFKYKGSGLYWHRHLKKHGNFVKTIEVWGFDDQELCTEFALKYSKQNNIVESAEWANMKPENALDGAVSGIPNIKAGNKLRGRKRPAWIIEKMREGLGSQLGSNNNMYGRKNPASEETKRKISQALTGKKRGPYKKKLLKI
jgi:hypothetical protein